ncbi:hypothetical protein BGZ46_006000 [Entomortierella lignicola]|nr:hypothetical protein BGZ46_006000 [Entomortierella lignicola]
MVVVGPALAVLVEAIVEQAVFVGIVVFEQDVIVEVVVGHAVSLKAVMAGSYVEIVGLVEAAEDSELHVAAEEYAAATVVVEDDFAVENDFAAEAAVVVECGVEYVEPAHVDVNGTGPVRGETEAETEAEVGMTVVGFV